MSDASTGSYAEKCHQDGTVIDRKNDSANLHNEELRSTNMSGKPKDLSRSICHDLSVAKQLLF
jgi:hypothetical protein